MKTCTTLLVALLASLLLSPTAAAQEKMRIIVDTDARAELDDQAAIGYALFSGNHFEVEGITVNRGSDAGHPYSRPVGIDQHFGEAVNMVKLSASNVPILKGPAGNYRSAKDHVNNPAFDGSDAVNFIIERAHAPSDRPLIIYACGNLTNPALALLKDPTITPNFLDFWHTSSQVGKTLVAKTDFYEYGVVFRGDLKRMKTNRFETINGRPTALPPTRQKR